MDEQTQLKEALRALMTLADATNHTLQVGQVEKECAVLGLDARQIRLVCAYLEMNHVNIEGFAASEEDKSLFRDAADTAETQTGPEAAKSGKRKSAGTGSGMGNSGRVTSANPKIIQAKSGKSRIEKETGTAIGSETGAESAYYQMYLTELKGIRPCTDEEESALEEELLAGSETAREAAKERLVEGNLHRVVQISKAYLGKGVLAADLVQEGNMALFMAIDSYVPGTDFRMHLVQEIENAMIEAIRQQTGSDDILNTLAADANALMKATEVLADRLGREATSEELAEHLHMSRERVETLVKLSLDAMNISNE